MSDEENRENERLNRARSYLRLNRSSRLDLKSACLNARAKGERSVYGLLKFKRCYTDYGDIAAAKEWILTSLDSYDFSNLNYENDFYKLGESRFLWFNLNWTVTQESANRYLYNKLNYMRNGLEGYVDSGVKTYAEYSSNNLYDKERSQIGQHRNFIDECSIYDYNYLYDNYMKFGDTVLVPDCFNIPEELSDDYFDFITKEIKNLGFTSYRVSYHIVPAAIVIKQRNNNYYTERLDRNVKVPFVKLKW